MRPPTCSLILALHISVFVATLVIISGFLLFMLRPFLGVIENETRRIAELLSQLPAEVCSLSGMMLVESGICYDVLEVLSAIIRATSATPGKQLQGGKLQGKLTVWNVKVCSDGRRTAA
jgi:hypothetical protein